MRKFGVRRARAVNSTHAKQENELRSPVYLAATLVLVALLAVSCGGSGGTASDFSVTTVEGDEFGLSEKRGEVVALYFMAGY